MIPTLLPRMWRAVVAASVILVTCSAAGAQSLDLPWRYPSVDRLVAIGDLHGDLEATRKALQLAGVIDEAGRWTGGKTVVVQLGDQTDRGDDELEILDLLERLSTEARGKGGAVHVLNGNHELMNADGDFRYVTQDGMKDACERARGKDALCDPEQARRELFEPGGAVAKLLSRRNTAVIVGRTLFVHGGIRPKYAEQGLAGFNQEVRSWLRKEGPRPAMMDDPEGPIWTRAYSEPDQPDCAEVEQVLKILDIDRMVVAHTVQVPGIAARCDDRVWRIDVGLARHYGGPLEILEITGSTVRVLGRR